MRQFYRTFSKHSALRSESHTSAQLASRQHFEECAALRNELTWTHYKILIRQKRVRFEDEDFYIDLVFYNFILKCFVLIDLKIGGLTHQDIGQMDGYVRMYEDIYKVEGDNPTIGLILCSKKNEAIAQYSVLSENRQLFASKYMLHLPTEEELRLELERERNIIEGIESIP